MWMDIENNAPEEYSAVIFCGETMARVTNNYILPAVHQVAPITRQRVSFPFLLLANGEAEIDNSKLDTEVVDSIADLSKIKAADFVHSVRSVASCSSLLTSFS